MWWRSTTRETYAVTFPDGRIATCVACDLVEDSAFFTKLDKGRAADVSFVLDQLTGPNPKWQGSALIDASRIGMSGHSAGGASAIVAMRNDTRIDAGIDAGIDMDGTTYIPASGLSRPFMFLGTQAQHSPGGRDTSWDRDWNLMTGWKRWLVVTGTAHASPTPVFWRKSAFGLSYRRDDDEQGRGGAIAVACHAVTDAAAEPPAESRDVAHCGRRSYRED